jgi:hypothetical protein
MSILFAIDSSHGGMSARRRPRRAARSAVCLIVGENDGRDGGRIKRVGRSNIADERGLSASVMEPDFAARVGHDVGPVADGSV